MSRGRKRATLSVDSRWETVFYNSVGTYVQIINNKLSEKFKKEPLSNYIKILGGYSFKTSEYTKQGVPIIRISDFNNEKVNLEEVVYYPESDKLKKFELVEGDILIALTGGTIAKLGIVQEGLGKLYLNQRVGKFHILNPELFEKEYVYWIARSVQSIIKNLAWGAAIPNVSPKQIEKLEFPIPNRYIQKGIIRFLNDLRDENINADSEYFDFSAEQEIMLLQKNQILADSLSKELVNQVDIVKKLRQQILQDAIQGKLVSQDPKDEPAYVLIEKIKAEKEKLIKEKKLKKSKPLPPIKDEEIPFEVPKNWVWCRLGELVNEINTGFSSSAHNQEGKGFVHLRPMNIDIEGRINLDVVKYVPESKCIPLKKHDIFFNNTNSNALVGKTTILNEDTDWVYSNHMTRIKLYKSSSIAEFITFYFNYLFDSRYFKQLCRQYINQASISLTFLKNELIIPLPPVEEQKRIVKKVKDLRNICDELEKEVKQNQNLTEQLLQSALKEALEPKN